jgi:hypothetical protein
MKGAWALRDTDKTTISTYDQRKCFTLKLFPTSRQKPPKSSPNPLVPSHATPSGKEKAKVNARQQHRMNNLIYRNQVVVRIEFLGIRMIVTKMQR